MVVSVRLESIAESELGSFLDTIRPPYAAERALADHIPYVEAERFVRRQFEDQLPQGVHTLGHHFFRIVDTVTAMHVGVAWLRLDKASREAYLNNVTVLPEHRRKGYAAEAVVMLLRFMFAERRYHRCEARIFAHNQASLALHRGLGFVEEGRLRDRVYLAGRHHDLVVLGLLADEFAPLHPIRRP